MPSVASNQQLPEPKGPDRARSDWRPEVNAKGRKIDAFDDPQAECLINLIAQAAKSTPFEAGFDAVRFTQGSPGF